MIHQQRQFEVVGFIPFAEDRGGKGCDVPTKLGDQRRQFYKFPT